LLATLASGYPAAATEIDALERTRQLARERTTPPGKPPDRAYTRGEERANVASHGIGVALSCIGLVLLVDQARLRGNAWHILSAAIFGTMLVLLYAASTAYHAIRPSSPRAKHAAKVVDHVCIYLLIAGSYTPFALVTLRSGLGWWLFGASWLLAALGAGAEAFWVYRPQWLSALAYVGMGWIAIFAIRPLAAALPPAGLWLLLGGGIVYTLGTIFYVMKRVRYMHAVWHGFVLGGSVCHFLAVILHVVPSAT
jgi:hemolysin III